MAQDDDDGFGAFPVPCPGPIPGAGSGGSLRSLAAPWRQGIVLVCRDCGKGRGSRKLARRLEEDLAEAGLRRRTRVIEVDCLSLCPSKPRVAVVLPGGAVTAVRPGKEREELVRFVVDRIPV